MTVMAQDDTIGRILPLRDLRVADADKGVIQRLLIAKIDISLTHLYALEKFETAF